MGASMTSKAWAWGRLHTFVGTSSRWGVEVTFDVKDVSLAIHLLNVWLVFEWWPE